MTEKIYQRQPYLKEYRTKVVSVEGNTVVLESTIFAPEAGGQPCDLGSIGGRPLAAVREKDGVVYHDLAECIGDVANSGAQVATLFATGPDGNQADGAKKEGTILFGAGLEKGAPEVCESSAGTGASGIVESGALEVLEPGAEVTLMLDWERRFDHMQNHLGEHMLSGLFKSEYGANNKGFHMGEEIASFDIDRKEITPQMLRNIEQKANRAVYAALPVRIDFIESAKEAKKFPLRKPLAVDEDILIVTVEGIDCCACCCPHPSDTSQVGLIKLLRTEKYKGMTRIYFKCGIRALLDYEQKHDVISELCEKYSADEFTLLEKERIAEAKQESLRRELNGMKDRFAEIQAEELLKDMGHAVIHEFERESMDELKRIAKKVTAKTDLPVILSSAKDLCVFLTHTGKSEFKCGAIVKEFAVGTGGKGGGSDTQAQAIFNNLDTMRNFVLIASASAGNVS